MKTSLGMQKSPDVGIGGLLGMGSSSLMSTTTAEEVRKLLATDVACSKQHLTTCSNV